MERVGVASSNICSIGYDEGSQTLEVEFTNGSVYQFYNVGQFVYEQLMQSPSKGIFFNSQIKNSYPFSRV